MLDCSCTEEVLGKCCSYTLQSLYFIVLQGFKTFIRSQGELKLSNKLVRSIASTECSKMPRLFFAGGGSIVVVVVGVTGLLFSIVFIEYKKSQNNSDYKDHRSDATDTNTVEEKDNHAMLSKETQRMTDASIRCGESVPILQ